MTQDLGASDKSDRATAAEPVVSALRDGIPSAEHVMLEAAIRVALTAHSGQLDKGGQPYILHPLRVMLACREPSHRVAALLHDVVEDSDFSLDWIEEMFGRDIADAVGALTRRAGEAYPAFIERCSENNIALNVKLADLADNMDLSRLGREPTMADIQRHYKYTDAHNTLQWARHHVAQTAAQAIEARQGQDPKGLDRNDESAVAESDAP